MATKIVIDHLSGSRAGQRQELEPIARVRFGRHPDNEVAFDAHKDLDASTRHAELRRENSHWLLLDVGSSNGTLVGGQKIARLDVHQGVPLEVEFGAGGPRVRLYIGDPDRGALVPETLVRAGKRAPTRPPDDDLAHASTLSAAHDAGGVAQAAASGSAEQSLIPTGGRGRRTVGVMVQHAREALHETTHRFRVTVLVMAILFALAIAGLIVWNVLLSRGSTAPRGSESLGEAGPRIVRQSREALYLLAFVDDAGEHAFCSSFAVAPTYLATNSHCVDRINQLRADGREVFAVRNGEPKARVHLLSLLQHPGYRSGARGQSKDVALVETDAALPRTVQLATRAQLQAIEPGVSMFAYGFPGRLARPSDPEATLTAGTIGRVTNLDERVASFADNVLLQHSAFTMEGTSGSPLFDASGAVIGVNTGSYVSEKDLRLYDPESKEIKDRVAVTESLSGYNVAIRSDLVGELMRAKGIQGAP